MYPVPLSVIILAAGKGKRMLSEIPKVLHNVRGVPMIFSVIKNALELEPEKLIVVLGYKSTEIKKAISNRQDLKDLDFAYQKNN